MKRDCALECGPDKTCFEDTCCSNKLKKTKKNALSSIDAEPHQQTNQSFEVVDETTTNIYKGGAPSTERTTTTTDAVELDDFSTNIKL